MNFNLTLDAQTAKPPLNLQIHQQQRFRDCYAWSKMQVTSNKEALSLPTYQNKLHLIKTKVTKESLTRAYCSQDFMLLTL